MNSSTYSGTYTGTLNNQTETQSDSLQLAECDHIQARRSILFKMQLISTRLIKDELRMVFNRLSRENHYTRCDAQLRVCADVLFNQTNFLLLCIRIKIL